MNIAFKGEFSRVIFMVNILTELLVDSVDIVGSGNLVVVPNVLPVDWITRIRSWFSVFRC